MGARSIQAAFYRAIARRTRLILWATVSEYTEKDRGISRNQVRKWLLLRADAVIVNGESGARYIKSFGVRDNRIFRAPQTTSIDGFLSVPAVRSEPSRRRLLYSGRLVERKYLQPFCSALIEWCEKHVNTQVEFWIAGDGPLDKALAATQRPRNLEMRFLGHVDYARLPEVYAQSGILVFPTLADEWGMVVVEALAAGLPVLGSEYSQAVAELVHDGKNGWIFRPDDPADLHAKLNRALSTSTNDLNSMAETARASVRHLTPLMVADQIMHAVEYAIANGS